MKTTQEKARDLAASFARNFSYFAQESVTVTVTDEGKVLARCVSLDGKGRLLAQNAVKGTYNVRTTPNSLAVIFSL